MNTITIPESINALISNLPDEGGCSDLRLEIARAYNKIVWDFQNNGFGNDWMPAILFLIAMSEKFGNDDWITGNSILPFYAWGVIVNTDEARKVIIDDLNKLGEIIDNFIEDVYDSKPEGYKYDFWNINTWNHLVVNEYMDYSKFMSWDFTDALEQMCDIYASNNCLSKFREIMNKAKSYISVNPNNSYPISNEEIKDELIECGVSEDDAEWYINLKNELDRCYPICY